MNAIINRLLENPVLVFLLNCLYIEAIIAATVAVIVFVVWLPCHYTPRFAAGVGKILLLGFELAFWVILYNVHPALFFVIFGFNVFYQLNLLWQARRRP